ncbi:MAG: MaoC family dehydratase N-terminal domain-containing protein [Candidatus Pacebacteria bacterium]|nr:MaoC family dehydratase N-terminal domain-containing protein [Candidatus Paceibacterota bacterium]
MNQIPYTNVADIAAQSTGDQWSTWGPERPVTKETIQAFAHLTDNHQWIHEDAQRCTRESPYGGLIAHGLLLVSLIPGLLPPEGFTISGHRVRIVRAIEQLRLPSPVYPGDTVHARVRRLSAYTAPSGKGTVVERVVEVWSLAGAKPAVVCILRLQYF